ncbi:MAG: hypothetical protein ACXACY_25300 [Candidatus Hodarchaeales archaeon]|jgi:hypothetical protein
MSQTDFVKTNCPTCAGELSVKIPKTFKKYYRGLKPNKKSSARTKSIFVRCKTCFCELNVYVNWESLEVRLIEVFGTGINRATLDDDFFYLTDE